MSDEIQKTAEEQEAQEIEQARLSVIADGEMAAEFIESKFYKWLVGTYDERIQSNIRRLHETGGENHLICHQLISQNNVLKEYRDMPDAMIEAAGNAADAAPPKDETAQQP